MTVTRGLFGAPEGGMMPGPGIAIIGAGMIGAAHAAGYRHHIARFGGLGAKLDAICDANEAQAANLAASYGFERTSHAAGNSASSPSVW